MLICSVLIAVVKLNSRFLWLFEASEWFCLARSGRYGLRWEQNPSDTMVTACAASPWQGCLVGVGLITGLAPRPTVFTHPPGAFVELIGRMHFLQRTWARVLQDIGTL